MHGVSDVASPATNITPSARSGRSESWVPSVGSIARQSTGRDGGKRNAPADWPGRVVSSHLVRSASQRVDLEASQAELLRRAHLLAQRDAPEGHVDHADRVGAEHVIPRAAAIRIAQRAGPDDVL